MSRSTVQQQRTGDQPRTSAIQDSERPALGGEGERKAAEQLVEQLRERFERYDHNLQFSVDDATGRSVVKVVDGRTDEVIRQIPPEDILELARFMHKLSDEDGGALFRTEA
ncbi:flagellar protein FlaG [Arhodomonas aquaeolei]|nr:MULTISPECIES: flagellar protein FlaG [Arhodomonas]MCS4502803.1 flagellar protein FlaG [Arhodomonas aquaeolei]